MTDERAPVEVADEVINELGIVLGMIDQFTDAGNELYEIVDGCVNDVISFQERHQLETDLEEAE